MGLISSLVDGFRGGFRAEGDPTDERYWSGADFVGTAAAGIYVGPTTALQISCIWQAVRLRAETNGSLSLILYRERADDGKERARDHYLWPVLRRRPNPFQTAQQFREVMTAHALLWGAGFAEIYEGVDSPVAALVPIHPECVTVERIAGNRVRFLVRTPGAAEPRTLVQEQMFWLQGFGVDASMPTSVLRLARETIGLWLAQEKFSALYFSQGARPSVWLSHPAKLSDKAWARLQEQKQAQLGGLRNAWRVQVAEEGMQVKELGFNPKDSQLVEAREAIVLDVARWFNVPEHMLRAGKSPTYASSEQFAKEFVDYTLRPDCVRWEQSIGRDLIAEEDVFAEFLLDSLLRGNSVDRANSYRVYVETGIMTRNEIRLRENLNPLDGLDEPLTPLNMDRTNGAAAPGAAAAPPPAVEAKAIARAPRRLEMIAESAARHVVRREIPSVRDRAVKLAGKVETWKAWVADFYREHALFVAEALQLELGIARAYAERHRDELLAGGLAVLEKWETEAVAELTALAVEEEPHA